MLLENDIYLKKRNISIHKLRELIFKLLQTIVPFGKSLCKWNQNIDDNVLFVVKLKVQFICFTVA